MRARARVSDAAPVLVERARTFGGFGPRGSRPGMLALTPERLMFTPADGGAVVEIPLDAVDRAVSGFSYGGPAEGRTVLKITYRKNLLFGVAVERPDRWVNAIETFSRERGHRPAVERAAIGREDSRRFRVVAVLMVLLVLLLGILLPLFFSWTRARANDRPSRAESTAVASGLPA